MADRVSRVSSRSPLYGLESGELRVQNKREVTLILSWHNLHYKPE